MSTPEKFDHVLCGECQPEAYICGTPRDSSEAIVGTDTPHGDRTACAVCFSRSQARCNECEAQLTNIIPFGVSLSPQPARPTDWFTFGLVDVAPRRSLWRRLLARAFGASEKIGQKP